MLAVFSLFSVGTRICGQGANTRACKCTHKNKTKIEIHFISVSSANGICHTHTHMRAHVSCTLIRTRERNIFYSNELKIIPNFSSWSFFVARRSQVTLPEIIFHFLQMYNHCATSRNTQQTRSSEPKNCKVEINLAINQRNRLETFLTKLQLKASKTACCCHSAARSTGSLWWNET